MLIPSLTGRDPKPTSWEDWVSFPARRSARPPEVPINLGLLDDGSSDVGSGNLRRVFRLPTIRRMIRLGEKYRGGEESVDIVAWLHPLIVELVNKSRLPAMYPWRDYVEAGGLMAYGADLGEVGRRMANDVHEILNGAKPGDIPIYRPTKFELVINLKTAKALGLTLPPALLAAADEVIE
jgi:hypothetical protein